MASVCASTAPFAWRRARRSIWRDRCWTETASRGTLAAMKGVAHLSLGMHFAATAARQKDAFVGLSVAATPGIAIGCRAVVGVGATATTDAPDGATLVGAPARAVKQ